MTEHEPASSPVVFETTAIPFILETVDALALLIHPNHIVYLCVWG